MKLQILINHYNEGAELVERLLRSIEAQRGVRNQNDYGIVIGNDGSDATLDNDFISQFSTPIRFVDFPHRGVCGTRNALLDMTEADYVMFCDADDFFDGTFGLSMILRSIDKHRPDVLISIFTAETKNNGEFNYTKIRDKCRWIHGKVFRRQYLLDNNIRFPDEMPTTGDMYFLWQAYHMTQNIMWIPRSFYTWKWNEQSVTRSTVSRKSMRYERMIKTYTLLTENLIARNKKDLYDQLIPSVIFVCYFDYQLADSYAREAITRYVKQFCSYYESIDKAILEISWKDAIAHKRIAQPMNGLSEIESWMNELKQNE